MTTVTSRGSIKAHLQGRGLVTLRPADHIATGGEGSIYRVGNDTVVKIYTDQKEMQRLGLPDKIRELSRLKFPYVVSPSGLVLSEKQDPIGYYMPYADGHPLSRVLTNDFWNREGFSAKHAQELVSRMRDTVSFAHSQKAIMVDANELNWLVRFAGSNPEPRVVDVDSWSIGRWPAKVIMPSIRDWSAKTFDEKSDWFAWGIVTFQVFTGLHPYKGTHPSYKKGDLIERMKANASVFSPNVRLNQAVRDFASIPKGLKSWYEAVFEKGERTVPPSTFDTASTASAARTMRVQTVGKSGLLIFEKLLDIPGDSAVRLFRSGAVLLSSGTLINPRTRRSIADSVSRDAEIARTADGWLILEAEGGKAVLRHSEEGTGRQEKLSFSLDAKGILGYENRLFTLGDGGLTEIKLHNFGGKRLASLGQTWSTLPNATHLFDGLGIQDAMGAIFAVLPIEDNGLVHVRVRELDGLRVIAGKAGNRFASVLAVDKSGSYRRVELAFSKDYSAYRADVSFVDQPDLNLAILPKGVNASIAEDGELLITVPSSGNVTTIRDKQISTNMALGNFGDQVVYLENGTVWSLRMK